MNESFKSAVMRKLLATHNDADTAAVAAARAETMANVQPIDAQNVAEYMKSLDDCGTKKAWLLTDFPSLAPVCKSAVFFFTDAVLRDVAVYIAWEDDGSGLVAGILAGVFSGQRGFIVPNPISVRVNLGPDGSAEEMLPRARDGASGSKAEFDECAADAMRLLAPALLAISFMNCKNVRRKVVEPKRRLATRADKDAGVKTTFVEGVRCTVLDIFPMKEVLEREGDASTQGLRRALHQCRGHFRTYVPERPLGGEGGFVGTVWVPQHVRGDAARGTIQKTYRVHPPAAPASNQ